jgi:transposase
MPKQIDYTLTPDQRAEIERVIRDDKRPLVVKRATALRLLHEGLKPAQVAQVLQVTLTTIYNWWQRFQQADSAGLVNQFRSGSPPRAKSDYWAVIEAALEQAPAHFGYTFTIWTLARLRDHAERETGIRLNARYLGERLKARGYVYRRPKHDLRVHQDAAARQAAEAHLEELKKTPSVVILSSSLWTKRP